jgi:hypothetical protein
MKNKDQNILDVISKIASLDFQQDVWVEGKYWDRVINFEEAVNTLDDYEFFEDIKANHIGLSENEQGRIENLLNKLLEYESRNPKAMISDPNWLKIVQETGEIYPILKKYKW